MIVCNAFESKALVNIIATNGITYPVCLHYTLTGVLNNIKIYDYPDTILVTGGTLKRLPDNVYGIRYEFVSSESWKPVVMPPGWKPVTKVIPPAPAEKIISGVDNTILYIGIGLLAFFLLKD